MSSIDLWVSAAGDDNNSGSSAAPLATMQEAMRRAEATGWSGYCHIHPLGSVSLGTDPVLPVPRPRAGAEPVAIVGSGWVDSGLGPFAVGGGAQGSNSAAAPTRGTLTGLALGGTNNRRGDRLRFASGANAGLLAWVASNGASDLTAHNPFGAPVAVGDVVALEVPSSVLTWTGVLTLAPDGGNVVTLYDGVELLCIGASAIGAGLFFGGGRLNFVASRLRSPSAANSVNCLAPAQVAFGLPTSILRKFHPSLAEIALGTYVQRFVLIPGMAVYDYYRSLLHDSRTQQLSGPGHAFYRFCCAVGASSCLLRDGGTAEFFNAYFDGVSATGPGPLGSSLAAICVGDGASIAIAKSTDVSGTVGGHGVAVDGSGRATITGLTGSGNAGFGLMARVHAQARVTDAGTGTTITGSSGEVSVGAAGQKLWNDVKNGHAADCTDLAHPDSQMVRVGP